MEIATFIIAIIGCVTGMCSLAFNFYKSYSEKPRIIIEVPVPEINGFIDNDPLKFPARKGLVIILRFSNPGINPISVKQVAIKQNDIFILPNLDAPTGLWLWNLQKSCFHISFSAPPEKVPFLIEAGNSVDITFYFPFADILYTQDASYVNVSIDTITERKNIRVNICELTYDNVINNRNRDDSK